MVQAVLSMRSTSLGTGTTKTQINAAKSLMMPGWARQIVAVRPDYQLGTTVTKLQQVADLFYLESDDATVNPFIISCCPIAGGVAANDTVASTPELETWETYIPLRGGEAINGWGKQQRANTAATYMGCTLIITDKPYPFKQKYAQVGTYTTASTSTGIQVGTAYSIYGATRIIKVYGWLAADTQVTDLGTTGEFRLTSADFQKETPIIAGYAPIQGTVTTSTEGTCNSFMRMAIYDVDIPVNPTCTLQDYVNQVAVNSGTTYWQTGIIFER